jgi:hypothetical protein
MKNLPRINPKRFILTHLNDDALARAGATQCEIAEDGMTVEV